jgi:hypothetical protein
MECSILADGTASKAPYSENGRKGRQIEAITRVESVDWVTRAGAGGRAIALAESEIGTEMKPKEKQEIQDTQDEPVVESEVVVVQESETPEEPTEQPVETEPATPVETEPEPTPILMEAGAVRVTLDKSGLPAKAIERLAVLAYADQAALDAAIASEKAYIKEITGSGRPIGLGGSAPVSEADPEKKYQERMAEIYRRYGLAG